MPERTGVHQLEDPANWQKEPSGLECSLFTIITISTTHLLVVGAAGVGCGVGASLGSEMLPSSLRSTLASTSSTWLEEATCSKVTESSAGSPSRILPGQSCRQSFLRMAGWPNGRVCCQNLAKPSRTTRGFKRACFVASETQQSQSQPAC